MRRRLALGLVLAAVGLAGCGDDDGGSDTRPEDTGAATTDVARTGTIDDTTETDTEPERENETETEQSETDD